MTARTDHDDDSVIPGHASGRVRNPEIIAEMASGLRIVAPQRPQ
jgi:hypothetical protein